MESFNLYGIIDKAFGEINQSLTDFSPELTFVEVGLISTVSTGIVKVTGLPEVGFEELLSFPNDIYGIAFNIDEFDIGVVLLGEYWQLHTCDEVRRTGRVMDVPVGEALIGRIINPLGEPLDGRGKIEYEQRLPIERPAPSIVDRNAGNCSVTNRNQGD